MVDLPYSILCDSVTAMVFILNVSVMMYLNFSSKLRIDVYDLILIWLPMFQDEFYYYQVY